MSLQFEILQSRPTAKGLIFSGDKILMVASRSRLTLPGGGIEPGETPKNAFFREINEELRLVPSQLKGVEEVGTVQAQITSKNGSFIAVWTLFKANLPNGVLPPLVNPSDEILAVVPMFPIDVMLAHEVSRLAKQAVSRFCDLV